MTKYTRTSANKILKDLKGNLKTIEEKIMEKECETENEQSATERILDSILEKGLSIMNKLLDRVDKKLDDDEFMRKIEDRIVVEVIKREQPKEKEETKIHQQTTRM